MRRLLVLILVAALAWSGYWIVGARTLDNQLETWLADERAAGRTAEAEVTVRGFPNRFDANLSDLTLGDPGAGWRWTAPFFQVLALSYRPNHVVAVWPPEQRIATPDGAAEVESERLRASAVFRPGIDLTLDRSQVEATGLIVTPDGGGPITVPAARLATRAGEDGLSQDIGIEATEITLSDAALDATGAADALPSEIGRIYLDATLRLDAPLDRHALSEPAPAPTGMSLRAAELDWGPLSLSAEGEVDVRPDGFLSGEVEVTFADWRAILSAARTAGLIADDAAGALRTGLSVLTGFGGGESLAVPLVFADGETRLGPVTLSPAPRLTPPDQRQ